MLTDDLGRTSYDRKEPYTNLITWVYDGDPLKDMFAEDAIEYMKAHSEEGQQYIYTIVLLNYENKSLQYLPIRVIYKSDINK